MQSTLLAKLESLSIPEPNSGCHLWLGRIAGRYGTVRCDGENVPAHRATWIANKGPIPDGLVIRHKCDVPLCVNLDHLLIGTQKDNIHDCVRRGRRPLHYRDRNPKSCQPIKLSWADIAAICADPRGSRAVAPDYGISDRHVRTIRRDQNRPSGGARHRRDLIAA